MANLHRSSEGVGSESSMATGNEIKPTSISHEIVIRSQVEQKADYGLYRQELRYDFFYSCAYCTMTEAEGQAVRYVIDHYIPRNARPELTHAYENLMYACDLCNMRKSDRYPPEAARNAGLRYFRPDQDKRSEHFKCEEVELEGVSATGEFTIDELDLNREQLRRLRGLRERLSKCVPLVEAGIMSLRTFQYDQLPPGMRGPAVKAIGRARDLADDLVQDIDEVLRAHAKSEMIDPDESEDGKKRALERVARVKATEGLFPGSWRAPRGKKT